MQKSYRGAQRAYEAFRRYARLGLDRRRMAVFQAYDCIRGVCRDEQDARDMLAVYDTLRLLVASDKQECIDAVRTVYFCGAGRRPRRNDVSYRVRRLAYDSHCDERTVYRRLRYAARLYGVVRQNEV